MLPSKILITHLFPLGLCLGLFHTPSFAIDATSLEAGSGNRSTFVRAGAQWNWEQKWFQSNGTHLSGYWDATAAQIRQNRFRNIQGNDKNLYDMGITPVFRLQSDDKLGWYVEGGIGAHYFSSIYDNNNRQFSTRFQFGDHIGVGYILNNKIEVSAKLQHFSNGSIKEPNDGANYGVVGLRYNF